MKRILLFMFCMILLTGTVSASWDWDNVGNYDEETRTIEIRNSILGIPFLQLNKVVEIQLKTPLNYKVPIGYQKVAEFEIKNYKDYSNALKNLKLFDLRNEGKEFLREYDYKYKTFENVEIDKYRQICEQVNKAGETEENCHPEFVGVHTEQREIWKDLNSTTLLKGNITLGIFTIVEKGDKVEWIPTFFGIEVNEWAEWTQDLYSNLISYYKLDKTSGVVVDSYGTNTGTNYGATRGIAGKINNSFSFDGTNDYVDLGNDSSLAFEYNEPFSVSLWTTGDVGVGTPFLIGKNTATGHATKGWGMFFAISGKLYVQLNSGNGYGDNEIQLSTSNIVVDGSTLKHIVITYNGNTSGAGVTIYVNNVSQGYSIDQDTLSATIINNSCSSTIGAVSQPTDYFNGTDDEIAIWSRELNSTEVKTLWNNSYGMTLPELLVINLLLPENNAKFTTNTINFSANITDPVLAGIQNVSLIINGSVIETNTSGFEGIYNFSEFLPKGDHNWTVIAYNDNDKLTSTATRDLGIDTIIPEVVLLAPPLIIDHHLINTNLSVNWSANDTNIDTCILQFEGVNRTVTCSDNQTQINITNSINRSIIFYVNDTFGQKNVTYRSWNYTAFENSQEFNNETLEGNINTFTANVTIIESNLITIANFIYNGTSTIGSFSQSGNDSILTIDFLTPNVDTETNLTFFWSLILLDDQIINLTSHNQTVISISLDDCSVNTVVLYNYTIVDEGNQSLLSDPANTTAELNINLLDTKRQNYIANFSKKYLKINPFAVCINKNLSSSTYIIDSVVKYEATDYSIEYYNIVNATITNSTIPENITLYDLFSADATEFKITFKAEDFTFVENALIYIDRQYITENNTFKTVELPKTDSNGQTVGHFVRNDVVYNIRVIKDGIVLGNFRNIIAFCEDYTIGACQMVLEAVPEDFLIFDYDEQLGIIFQSIPTYNENTSAVSFDFSTDDGTVKTVLMEVTRDDIFGNRSICNNTITSSSGTLICSVDPNIDDSILRVSVSVDGQPVVLSNVKLESSDYGNLGYVLWFFLTFLFLLLFAHSKTEVLIGLAISFIGAISLGITRGNIIGLGSAGIWVLVIIILGIYKLNKEKPQ